MKLTGANTYTGVTAVNGGTLMLDFSAAGAPVNNILSTSSPLTLGGGTLLVNGKGSSASVQTMGAANLTAGTTSGLTIGSGGSDTKLTVASLTRGTGAVLNLNLANGLNNTFSITTPTGITAGIQLLWINVTDSGGPGFGMLSGNTIVKYSGATSILDPTSNTSTTDYTTTPTDPSYSGSILTMNAGSHDLRSLAITSGSGGTISLAGASMTFASGGGLVMSGAGNFAITGGAQLGAAASALDLIQNGPGVLTISTPISGSSGTLTKSGAGELVLSGTSAYTGATTISGGTLTLSGAGSINASSPLYIGTALSLGGTYALANPTTLSSGASAVIDTKANAGTLSGVVAGAGSLVKVGAGTLTLTGNNTYAGGTQVNVGMLTMKAPSDANWTLPAGALTIASGSSLKLDFSPFTAARQNALPVITLNSGGTLELLSNLQVVDGANLTGTLNGFGTVNKTGIGIVEFAWYSPYYNLSGFSGQFNVIQGALACNGNNVIWGTQASVDVAAGAYLDLRNCNIAIDKLTGSGTVGMDYSGTFALSVGNNNGNSSFSGVIQNSLSGLATFTGSTAGGILGLTKNGTGTQSLTGANTYSGTTTISGGTLTIEGSGKLGNGNYAGAIANNANLVYNSTANQTFGGSITGTGLLIKNNSSSTLTLNNATYTGTTTINGGEIQLGAANTGRGDWTINNGGVLRGMVTDSTDYIRTFTVNAGGRLVQSGGSYQQLYNGNLGGTILIMNGGSLEATVAGHANYGNFLLRGDMTVGGTQTSVISADFRMGDNADRSFTVNQTGDPSGIDLDITGNFSHFNGVTAGYMTKNGPGTMRFRATSNNQVYRLTINGGKVLMVDNMNGWYSGIINNGAAFEASVNSELRVNYGYALSGTGSFTLSGGGTLAFNAGGLAISQGQFYLTNGRLQNHGNSVNWSANTGNMDISNGATLDLYADAIYVDQLTGLGTVQNTFGNASGQSGSAAYTEKLIVGVANGSSTFAGILRDTASNSGKLEIEKRGTGTFTLINTNTYVGITTITGGMLTLTNAGLLGSGNYAAGITDNATLNYASTAAQTFSGIISGSGALYYNGTGTLTLSTGTGNSFSGGSFVTNGTVYANAGNTGSGALGGGNVTVYSGGTITVGSDNSFVGYTVSASRTITINAGGMVINPGS